MTHGSDGTMAISTLASYNIDSHWFQQQPAERTLLVAYAHPDDESFSSAGMIARYTAAGVAVHYVCATRGEAGKIGPAAQAGYTDVAALRTAELTCAARVLGLDCRTLPRLP